MIFCLTFRPNARSNVLARTTHSHARDDRSFGASHAETTRSTGRAKSTKRGYLHFRSTGTNIFLFRARTHTTAKEWLWRLYRVLGGRLPPLLEVRVPGLDAKLYFRIPRDHDPDGDELYDRSDEDMGYRHLQPDDVIEKCIERLSTVTQWKELVETAQRQGTCFRLAWRRGSILDWITDPPPGEAAPDWAVVGGFAFRQVSHGPPRSAMPYIDESVAVGRVHARPGITPCFALPDDLSRPVERGRVRFAHLVDCTDRRASWHRRLRDPYHAERAVSAGVPFDAEESAVPMPT